MRLWQSTMTTWACCLLFPLLAHPRWALPEESSYTVLDEKIEVLVRADFTSEVITTNRILINTERARSDFGLLRQTYDSKLSRIEILEAWTEHQGKRYPLQKDQIEIKPLASLGPGFDEVYQLTAAFPQVQVGSTLYLKQKRVNFKSALEKTFWLEFWPGFREHTQKWSLVVQSEIPLEMSYNDPKKILQVRTKLRSSKSFAWSLEAKLLKPNYQEILEEDSSLPFINNYIWLGVSSLKSWSDLPKSTIRKHEEVVSAPLPASLEKVLVKIRQMKDRTDQFETLMSEINDLVRYVGDWRLVEGAFHPRNLDEILKSGYGDCKDYSAMTVALLRRLGFEAHFAWIMRGRDHVEIPFPLKIPSFNHAIVQVKLDGADFFLDPTNAVSFAREIFPDIENRRVLILEPTPRMARTPALIAHRSVLELDARLKLFPASRVEFLGEVTLSGTSALSLTGIENSFSKKQIDYSILNWITNIGSVKSYELSRPQLKERRVRDLQAQFKIKEHWIPQQSSQGPSYVFSAHPLLKAFQFQNEERVGSLSLATPVKMKRRFMIDQPQNKSVVAFSCQGSSPWISFKRTFGETQNGPVFEDEVIVHQSLILAPELKSKEFIQLQKQAKLCLGSFSWLL